MGCSCKAAGNQLVFPCLNAGHPPHSQSTTEGSTVAVFGCGAIGLGVINTSALVSASRIIAIDTNPGKEDWAKKFGATDFVNPTKLKEGQRIQDYLVEITDGGLDYTFDCTGNVRRPVSFFRRVQDLTIFYQVQVMRAALEACHKGWGVSTVIGVAAAGQEISTRPSVVSFSSIISRLIIHLGASQIPTGNPFLVSLALVFYLFIIIR